jgi:ribose transport system substrate-binding protein
MSEDRSGSRGEIVPMGRNRLVASFLSEDQEFQVMQAADARVAAERAGLTLEVLYAENNAVLQIQQLYRFVHAAETERPVAIIVETVVGEGLERVARNAARAGVGWVLLNRNVPYLEALRREHPRLPISVVTTDQLGVGRIQGRQFRALLPKGGSVLYLQGPPDTSVAQERLRGMQETTAGTNVQVKVLNGEWTQASAERAVVAWLRLKTTEAFHPDLIGCQNDEMAVGARKALTAQRKEWGRLPLTGCDGLPDGGQRLVTMKLLAATVVIPSNAGPAVELVARHLRAGDPVPPRVVLTGRSYPLESQLGGDNG